MTGPRHAASAVILAAGLLIGAPPAQAQDLGGGTWRAVSIAGARTVRGQELTFDKGRLFGSDGCNRMMGAYDRRGKNGIRIGGKNMGMTMMACPPGVMRSADAFMTAIRSARSWSIRGARLILRDAAGRQVATFRR